MRRAEVRREVLKYLESFFSEIVLYQDEPVKQKMRVKSLARDFYEQLEDAEKQEIYLKIKNQI